MKMIKGYVKFTDEQKNTHEEECMIIELFSWSDGTITFPVAVIMLRNGELQQHPISNVRVKINKTAPSSTILQ